MHTMVRILFIFCALITSWSISAQSSYFTHFSNKEYDKAISAAKEHLTTANTDSMAMHVIGASYVNLGQWDDADKYLHLAKENGLKFVGLKYMMARLYTHQGRINEALSLLEEMAATGMGNYILLDHDDLRSLQDHNRWQEARLTMYKVARPCEFDDNYRRFDFWVGEWDVYAGGAKIADSWISHSNDKCGILEDYKTLGVFAGNSITYYDAADSVWKQNWIAGGGATHFVEMEGPYEGNLSFIAESKNAQGKKVKTRMTFYKINDNEVRQHLEVSTDEGSTWSTNFDGTYKRKS